MKAQRKKPDVVTTQEVVKIPQEMETQRKRPDEVTTELELDTNEKPKGSTNMTEGESCLDVCINARKLEKPQHKCRRAFCDQPVSQICQCNIEDPDSNNPMHRIHKSMKSCRITKELQQKVSTNMDPLMCTECGRTAKTSAALECHMKSLHGMSVAVLKCNVCEKEFRSY